MCTFYLITPSSPIILSGCDNIKFAPYNSTYPNIEEDAYVSGLSDSVNLWDKPIVVAQNQFLIGSHWSLMNPTEFSILTVPVEVNLNRTQSTSNELINRANEVFGVLPAQYEQELSKRYQTIEENLEIIQTSGLNQEQRLMLQKFIEQSFKESLQQSGDQKQLDQLALITNNLSNQINIHSPHISSA